jgi:hypothetical protein
VPVPYQREAMVVIEMWRAVERDLALARPGSREAESLQIEAARLRDEYQRLVTLAREHHRPEPPPFPGDAIESSG